MGNLNMWSAKIFMYSWMAVMVHGDKNCDQLATSGNHPKVTVAFSDGTCKCDVTTITAPSDTMCTITWDKKNTVIADLIKSWTTAKKSNYYECILVQGMQGMTHTPTAVVLELAKTYLSGARCAGTANKAYASLSDAPKVEQISKARTDLFGKKPLDAVCAYLYPVPKKIKETCAPLVPITPKKCGLLLRSECGPKTEPYIPYKILSKADLEKLEAEGKKEQADAYRKKMDEYYKRYENVTEDVSKVVCSFLYPRPEEQEKCKACKDETACKEKEDKDKTKEDKEKEKKDLIAKCKNITDDVCGKEECKGVCGSGCNLQVNWTVSLVSLAIYSILRLI